MPQLRSFGAYAPKPDLAGSELRAAALVQQGDISMREIAQRGAIANQNAQIAREKIQADMVQSNMEMQARQQALQSQAMRDEQELKIKQQYQQTMLSMQEREIAQKQAVIQRDTQQAARVFAAQQAMQKQYMEGGETPESFQKAALMHGPMAKMPGSVYSQAMQPQGSQIPGFGEATPIPGLPEDRFKQVRTGKGSTQIVRLPDSMEESGPVPAGYTRAGRRIVPERESLQVSGMRKELARLEKSLEGKTYAPAVSIEGSLALRPDRKLQPSQIKMLEEYRRAKTRAGELRAKLEAAGESGGKGPAKITSQEEYDDLEVGDKYIGPDGKPRTKK